MVFYSMAKFQCVEDFDIMQGTGEWGGGGGGGGMGCCRGAHL